MKPNADTFLKELGYEYMHGASDSDPPLAYHRVGRLTLDEVADELRACGFTVERRGTWLRVNGQTVTGTQARGLLRFKESNNRSNVILGSLARRNMNKIAMRELAKKLYEKAPVPRIGWDQLHERVQQQWVQFAEYAYHLIKDAP